MDKPHELEHQIGFMRLGQIVLSKRGKDCGEFYVIVGFCGKDRLALADAVKFNVSRPKFKNPRHVQPTSMYSEEFAVKANGGADIDRGRLCQILGERGKIVL